MIFVLIIYFDYCYFLVWVLLFLYGKYEGFLNGCKNFVKSGMVNGERGSDWFSCKNVLMERKKYEYMKVRIVI